MDKKNSSTKRRNVQRAITLIIILICCCLFYLNFLMNEDLKKYTKELEEVKTEYYTQLAEYASITKEMSDNEEKLKDIENAATEDVLKEEYFNLVKLAEEQILNGESDLKIAYLTFDDGPYLKSPQFLDVLDEYNVPATFFYLKKDETNNDKDVADAYDEVYRRIIDSRHTLGNHTASHALRSENSVYQSVDYFVSDILKNREFIQDRYGYTTTVMRFPGGSATAGNKKDAIMNRLYDEGYCYVDWNSETGDGTKVLEPAEFRDNVLNNTNGKQILVVLMHDYSANTLIALPEIIEGLQEQGYIFVPMFNGAYYCK